MSAVVKSILNAGAYGPDAQLYEIISGWTDVNVRLLLTSGVLDDIIKLAELESRNAVGVGVGTVNIKRVFLDES